jgi:putative Holliday junction resolvase
VSAAAVAPPKTTTRTVLAFDYGDKHIGVAVGDTATRIAHPIGRIDAARAFENIDALVREWRPDALLVGMPLAAEGGEHPISARVRRFGRQLASRYRLPVSFADERYSSTAAEETLKSVGRGGRKNKQLAHAVAASTILQGYLDEPARR